MDLLSFSPWGLLAAVAASMVVGSLWFSPLMFAPVWMKLVGLKNSEIKNAPMAMTWTTMLVSITGTALLLSALKALLGLQTLMEMVILGAGLSVFLYGLPTLSNAMFAQGSKKLWAIYAGYHAVFVIAQAAVLSFF